jgi:imidazole glycerol-phosphate synthase subunit HisH
MITMTPAKHPVVAIIDMGLGNLFSVKSACEFVGLTAYTTSSRKEIDDADAIIIPGVGAFGDAMNALNRLGLIPVLDEHVENRKPLLGICLGMQILLAEGTEFGNFDGLSYVDGTVIRFENPQSERGVLKVPEICWNRMVRTRRGSPDVWSETPLEGLPDGVFMYFNHSYYVKTIEPSLIIAETQYGDTTFCSAFRKDNIFGIQAHPERSGKNGLKVYENFLRLIECSM